MMALALLFYIEAKCLMTGFDIDSTASVFNQL